MKSSIVSRLIVFLATTFLVFAWIEAAPGDFLTTLETDGRVSQETLRRLREEHELERSFAQRWLSWAISAARGDLGRSFAYDLPVTDLLAPRIANTLGVAAAALVLSWLAALLLAALRIRGSEAAALAALSVPDLVIALSAAAFAARAGWSGHVAIPLLALVLATAPALARQTRAAFDEARAQPFVLAARADGVARVALLLKYMLPAALPSLIALLAVSVGSLLSTSLLVECIAGWPGLGPLLLDAVFGRDTPVIAGALLASALLWTASSVLADALLWLADPRVRA